MNLVDPLEPDGARMERAFTEFPEEMGELKAAFPELSAMDLARFLSATEYDLQLAMDRVVQHVEWRRSMLGGDRTAGVQKELDKGVFLLQGVDRHKHPIMWVEWRKADGGSLFGWGASSGAIETKVRAVVSRLEEAFTNMETDIHRLLIVINITGVRVDQVDVFLIRQYICALQANYPERLYRILVVPTGMIVNMFWQTVSMILNERPRHKVVFLSSCDDMTMYIDPQHIPVNHRPPVNNVEEGKGVGGGGEETLGVGGSAQETVTVVPEF